MKEIEVGDVVRLKGGGGPRMTVEQADARSGVMVIRCIWWSEGQGFDRGTFPPGTLELVPTSRRRRLRARVPG